MNDDRPSNRVASRLLAVATVVLTLGTSSPMAAQSPEPDFTELSIEELMAVEISSVARRPQRFIEAAAAVYVLTAGEIAASAAEDLPDLLRLVPGMMVARSDANSWAITARGFNSTSANKLQVLIDGRSLYTPLFSGVFWDVQNLPLDIIERIEIVRGPGAVLWGANAVNGVINIITKPAADTEGEVLRLSAGSEATVDGYFRAGGRGERAAWRTWVRTFERDASELAIGGDAVDDWDMAQAGFRIDSLEEGRWMIQGGAYDGAARSQNALSSPEPPFSTIQTSEDDLSGAFLLGRWSRPGGEGGELTLQSFVDHTERSIPDFFGEQRTTVEVDFQHRLGGSERHELMWGATYRVSDDDVENSFTINWQPSDRTLDLFGAFVQNEIRRRDGRGELILGVKVEHNEFTDFEVQPNIRGSWRPTERRALWGAISRAVRTPSRLDHDAQINAAIDVGPPPVFFALVGNDGFAAEDVIAAEFGYREQLSDTLSIDVAIFANQYDNLLSIEDTEAPEFMDGVILLPFVLSNQLEGRSRGAEFAAAWNPHDRFDLRGGVTLFYLDLELDQGSTDGFSEANEDVDPRSQGFIQAHYRSRGRFASTVALRWVDELRSMAVEEYVELDLRLDWELGANGTFSLVGRDLLDDAHLEFANGTLVERSVTGVFEWRF